MNQLTSFNTTNPGLVKILISTNEYARLLHIEKQYIEEQSSEQSRPKAKAEALDVLATSEPDQVGTGISRFVDHKQTIDNLAIAVANLILRDTKITDIAAPTSQTKTELTTFIKKSLKDIFGIPPLGKC